MRFSFLKFSSSRAGRFSRKDAKVFAEACQLAVLRLEQCIADSYISLPRADDRQLHRWTSTAKATYEPNLNPALMETGASPAHNQAATAYGREVM